MIVFSWENQGFQSEDRLMQAAFWVVNVDFNPKNDFIVIDPRLVELLGSTAPIPANFLAESIGAKTESHGLKT